MKALGCLITWFLTATIPFSAAANSEPQSDHEWHFSVAPYLWSISLDGEQQTHNAGSDIDRPINLDMGAAISGFEFGLLGHLEARKSKWGWFVDFAYVALELEANLGPVIVDEVGFDGVETELAAVYRPDGVNGKFDVFAGVRYWDLSAEIPRFGNVSYTEQVSWTDFMVGARYTTDLSPKWRISLRGDLAGANSGSDLTVNLSAVAGFRVSEHGEFVLGWRYMDVKFVQGNPDDVNDESYYDLDVIFTGPLISYNFSW